MTSHCRHPFGFHPVKDLGEIIMILELQRAMRIVRLGIQPASRRAYTIAMHRYESGVVENGDDTLSRKRMPFLRRAISKITLKALSLFIRSGRFERFRPDFTIDE
jgi:hypothetical protein